MLRYAALLVNFLDGYPIKVENLWTIDAGPFEEVEGSPAGSPGEFSQCKSEAYAALHHS